MSLAMFASPYEIEKPTRAKTQKNSEKVKDVLQSINEDTLADFDKEEIVIEEIKKTNQPRTLTNYHKIPTPFEIPKVEQRDVLMEKVNYIIGLLENQQDEKTNNVIEDLIIYSLLGCFIIFIIDKFVSVGKYVRD
jgi:hypothetical protein